MEDMCYEREVTKRGVRLLLVVFFQNNVSFGKIEFQNEFAPYNIFFFLPFPPPPGTQLYNRRRRRRRIYSYSMIL